MCLEDREQLFGEHKQQRSICTHKSRKLENPLSLVSYICVLYLYYCGLNYSMCIYTKVIRSELYYFHNEL